MGVFGSGYHQDGLGAVYHGVGQSTDSRQHSLRADAWIAGRSLVHPIDVVHQFVDDDDHGFVTDQPSELVGAGVSQNCVAFSERVECLVAPQVV